MTISSRVQDVRNRRPQALIGQPVEGNYLNGILTLINKNPQAAQVSTLTVNTATNSHLYTLSINGVDVEYQADGGTSAAEIADGLELAINEEPLVRGQLSADSDGASVVTLTGLYPGIAFTLADVDSKLTAAAVTAAAEADSVGFGLGVMRQDYQSDEANGLGSLVKSTSLAYQVDTLTADYSASEEYFVSISMEGETYGPVDVVANTDDGTTATDIATAINAMMPANTVIAAATSGGALTLTAEVKGKAFTVAYGTKSGTAARLTLAHTTATVNTDINKVFAGVSVYAYDEEVTAVEGTTVVYPANAGMRVLSSGLIWVQSSETVTQGAKVYIETDSSSANVGRFYTTTSSTRLLLSKVTWERSARSDSGDSIAALRVAA